jgi:predicted nucleotidyltransferase
MRIKNFVGAFSAAARLKIMTGSEGRNSTEEIRKRLSPLFKDEGLQFIVLFGSLASGRIHKESDIDLAFLFDEPTDILALTNRVIRLLHADKIDVVDLRRASPLLCFAAARQGKLLHERSPGLFNSFYSLAFRRYVDTKKLRDARGNTIKHFLQERGLA